MLRLFERFLMSKEERQEKQRLDELRDIFADLRRGIFVTFNESASPDAEVTVIRALPHVEDAAASFDRTAIILADSAEYLDQVTEAIRKRNVAIRIMTVSP